jgi:hypothetical protein
LRDLSAGPAPFDHFNNSILPGGYEEYT